MDATAQYLCYYIESYETNLLINGSAYCGAGILRKHFLDFGNSVRPVPAEDEGQRILRESQKSGRKKTVLVVEDNEDIRFYLKDNLKGFYKVEEATNGKEDWEKVKQLNPDLVVSDIMRPLMDGVELARKLKPKRLLHISPSSCLPLWEVKKNN